MGFGPCWHLAIPCHEVPDHLRNMQKLLRWEVKLQGSICSSPVVAARALLELNNQKLYNDNVENKLDNFNYEKALTLYEEVEKILINYF